MKTKISIHEPKTVKEAIQELEEFFAADMWYAKTAEWKKEKDMIKYLETHFKILKEQVRKLTR